MEISCPKCGAKDDLDLSEIPPGKAILRCEKCNANFEVIIKSADFPQAKCDTVDEGLSVLCPACKKRFLTTASAVAESKFWRCPDCESIFRIGTEEPEKPQIITPREAKLITEPQIASTELDALEAQLGSVSEEPSIIEPEREPMLPPLPDKDRFTAQFIVKVAGAELGPISFNVLEDWARSGMIPRDALVAKADEGRYHRADRMPELLAVFEKTSSAEPGSGIREILKEESTGTVITHGAIAGILGGFICGIAIAIIVLLGLWQPMWAFPISLQALITLGMLTIVGAAIGAITASVGQWLIGYSWTPLVQVIIATIFAIGMFTINIATSQPIRASGLSAVAVFAIVFSVGYIGCLFHHKFFEKIE